MVDTISKQIIFEQVCFLLILKSCLLSIYPLFIDSNIKLAETLEAI